jgi:hypothetical protein
VNTITSTGALQAPVDGDSPGAALDVRAARSAEGLVSYQQSLRARTGTKKPLPNQSDDSAPCGVRYRVTASNGDQTITIDSRQARLLRCQRRIHAWAEALPKAPRRVRRAGSYAELRNRWVMLTLTYKDGKDWHINDIRDYMILLRATLGNRLYAYAWVLEMQKRGAPHYHVILYVQRGTKIPKPDAGMWRHGLSRIETVKTPYYICKYTSKGKQKEYQKEGFPAGARMFAVKIYNTDIPADELLNFRMSTLPAWLRPYIKEAYDEVGLEVTWRRNRGGGWLIVQTGEVLYSPWIVTKVERLE